MNKKTTTRKSQTDWARVDMMTGEDIDLSDFPEIRPEQFAKAMVQRGGLPSAKHRYHVTSCPQCGRTSRKIYSLQMGNILLLFRHARWDYWYESGCRACIRQSILRFAWTNIATAHIMWLFFILPLSLFYLILSCF
jgi:hypothetical protein